MLVLSRRIGERIRISDDIVLTVVAVRGNQVRLGIEAPPSVVIRREELCDFAPLTLPEPLALDRPRR